jgi:hypothetical protein
MGRWGKDMASWIGGGQDGFGKIGCCARGGYPHWVSGSFRRIRARAHNFHPIRHQIRYPSPAAVETTSKTIKFIKS